MWPAVADFLVSADPVTIIAATHTRVSGRSGSIRFTWILYAGVSDIGATGVIAVVTSGGRCRCDGAREF